jgi:polyphosphate kinase 2 (PPK2 family)
VTKNDWRHHRQYDNYLIATEEMLANTDTDYAPWTVVEAHDRRFATVKIFNTVINTIEQAIDSQKPIQPSQPPQPAVTTGPKNTKKAQTTVPDNIHSSVLDRADLTLSLPRDEYESELSRYQNEIMELEHLVYLKRIPVIIVYQGWDAAGKGGNIKRLVQKMDPRGYEVITTSAPNDIEKAHHYLWRFWMKIPKAGHITIFDRSWYGRVLVERIEGFAGEDEWKRAYREINEMEKQLVNFGTVLIKFWIHISTEEQLRRFEERKNNPYKQWKISEEDWRNREKWDLYQEAVDEMLFRTSTTYAPWIIVESNCKLYARIKTLKTCVKRLKERL